MQLFWVFSHLHLSSLVYHRSRRQVTYHQLVAQGRVCFGQLTINWWCRWSVCRAVPSKSASGLVAMMISAGSYMGEGLFPIPEKLVKKIIKLEFIEMHELLPEFWLRGEESKTLLGLPRRKKAPTTNILQWLQCFLAMVGVLARAYPQMVPNLMAYQATIIRCYFEDLHWAQYDRMYQRQVSITKDLRWGKVNFTASASQERPGGEQCARIA